MRRRFVSARITVRATEKRSMLYRYADAVEHELVLERITGKFEDIWPATRERGSPLQPSKVLSVNREAIDGRPDGTLI